MEIREASVRLSRNERNVVADNGRIRIETDLATGEFSFRWKDGMAITGLFGEAAAGHRRWRTNRSMEHRFDPQSVESVADGFGRGIRWTVEHVMPGTILLRHRFWCYEELPYAFVELEAVRSEEWETNDISPLAALQNDGTVFHFGEGGGRDVRVLFVPFDNDKWVRYASYPLPASVESCEATAVYEPESRKGFVLGSVTHDFWKTGLRMEGAMPDEISRLRVYGGAAGLHTRDTVPHGAARGTAIASPRIFVGAFDDYRAGLEAYGRANAVIEPKLPWSGGVPFGWNSWSAVMDQLDFETYVGAADFLCGELQTRGFENDGTVYVNFDAFWSKLSREQLAEAVSKVKANGQKPGIYFTPFTFWGQDPDVPVEGVSGTYTYRDLLLKDDSGEILPRLAGGCALDPSHPAVLERIRRELKRFVDLGFDYVKLDFLSHGALEGKHYLPEVRSGIQAYRMGMAAIRDALSPARVGRPFFINLSIAPLFPHGFAHGRRMSCDVFGLIGDTEYLLNALTYGWWVNDTLYRFNDPDHTVLYKSANQQPSRPNEGRSRLTASIIAGTSLLLGDDFRNEEAARRAREWLAKGGILDLARKGVSFRPAESAVYGKAADVFVLSGDRECHVAVFNFDGGAPARKRIPFGRIGVPESCEVRVTDMWDGADAPAFTAKDALDVTLQPAEAKLYHLRFDGGES
jgi:hypothetical protein